jgi:hypothetical protein
MVACMESVAVTEQGSGFRKQKQEAGVTFYSPLVWVVLIWQALVLLEQQLRLHYC